MSKIVLSADAFLELASEVDSRRLSTGRYSWTDHEEMRRLMETPPGRSRRSTRDKIARRSSRKARSGSTAFEHTGPASDVRAVYAEPTYPGWRTKAGPVKVRHRPF